ncbi:hypothetical protein B566_EDAN001952 [Ephemera danica]|nr:hypothetical protein B566_EDAN001952 [Ephemera danica]
MIDSVICARDKHLNPGGLMYPERATIKCAPCSTPRLLDYWDDVYSVKMTAMKEAARKCLATKPEITTLQRDDVLCEPRTVMDIDMNTVAVTDVTHVTSRVFVSTHREGLYQGLAIWFDVTFPGEGVLSTAPSAPVTHWQQTVVVLPQDQLVEEGDVLGFELQFER